MVSISPLNREDATTQSSVPTRKDEPPRTIVLCDRHGGLLTLDVACPGVTYLVDAFRYLVAGSVPPNASLIKVDTGGEVYLLSRRYGDDGAECIRVANLYDPAQDVRLPRDLPDGLFALIEQLVRLPRRGSHRGH